MWEGGGGAEVISNAEHIRERPDIQSGGIVEAALAAISGGLPRKVQLRKKSGPKPSEKEKDRLLMAGDPCVAARRPTPRST